MPRNHIICKDSSPDPWQSHGELGRGGFSSVEFVRLRNGKGNFHARKCIRIPARDHDEVAAVVRQAENEISILGRLKHDHIIRFEGSYQWQNNIYILMPKAETDLRTFMLHVDQLPLSSPERRRAYQKMRRWPACLFRALEYTHRMHVRHKDIKPENILIVDGKVMLADFGISKDFGNAISELTSGTPEHITLKYASPEVVSRSERGYPSDVFSLGCVMLELCSLAGARGQGELVRFETHRCDQPGLFRGAFWHSPFAILEWISELLANWQMRERAQGNMSMNRSAATMVLKLLPLAFLMMDPEPNHRIKSRQLVDMMNHSSHPDFHELEEVACTKCRETTSRSAEHVRLHSTFKKNPETDSIALPNLVQNIDSKTVEVWEVAKSKWLETHISW